MLSLAVSLSNFGSRHAALHHVEIRSTACDLEVFISLDEVSFDAFAIKIQKPQLVASLTGYGQARGWAPGKPGPRLNCRPTKGMTLVADPERSPGPVVVTLPAEMDITNGADVAGSNDAIALDETNGALPKASLIGKSPSKRNGRSWPRRDLT